MMISMLVDETDTRLMELLSGFLRMEGYALEPDGNSANSIRIVPKYREDEKPAAKGDIVELENALYYQKKGVLYKSILENVEKPMIERALERTEGNQLKASKMLGMNRNTMRAKIKKLGIDVTRWKER